MEEAEHHISLQDVKVPCDDGFPFQNLHNYLRREQNKPIVESQILRGQPLCKHAFLHHPSVKPWAWIPKEDTNPLPSPGFCHGTSTQVFLPHLSSVSKFLVNNLLALGKSQQNCCKAFQTAKSTPKGTAAF